ncbi:MAG: glutaminase A, partial [Actinobacteria bacterium]|nr:glutaminase A [Actinomycetota bacterium]
MGRTPLENRLQELYERLRGETGGALADYIPELSQADPSWFGLATTTVEGDTSTSGDAGLEFSIQSISKPFVYAMALLDKGEDYVLDHVGIEPTGDPFNAVTLSGDSGRPLNPMVNAGAIVTSTLVNGADHLERGERIRDGLSRFAGRDLSIDLQVARSEWETSDRNRAISYLMRGAGSLTTDVEDALSAYIAQCSVLVTATDLSVMAATLAAGGRNPLSDEQVVPPELIAPVLTIMSTCGMYDGAGEWMYRVGLPAKSGVSGAIMAVLPNELGLATWSPPLDRHGNSVRGVAAMELLSDDLDLHVYFPTGAPHSPIRRVTSSQVVRARTGRIPAEQTILDLHGERISIVEMQGSISLLGAQEVAERIAKDDPDQSTGWLVVDVREVDDFHPGALKIVNESLAELASDGVVVEVVERQRAGGRRAEKSWL